MIAFFCVSMAAALIYALMNPARNFAEIQVIDDSAILVHNGQNHRFTQGSNEFFAVSALSTSFTYPFVLIGKGLDNCVSKKTFWKWFVWYTEYRAMQIIY